jgi:hypothetical protein
LLLLLGTLLLLPILVLLLLLGTLLLPPVLVLLLLLGTLLLLPVLVLLLVAVVLLFGLGLLFVFGLFFFLLVLLSVGESNGSDKTEQNCRADYSKSFHEGFLTLQLKRSRSN